MSINRILSNGVLGATAQSHALNVISDNIANARTTGYKRSEAQFSDFVVTDRFSNRLDGAGVRPGERLRTDSTGSIEQTGQSTNAAIIGNGFFLVQEIDQATGDPALTSAQLTANNRIPELTRAGDFSEDQYGNLVNSTGRALMGFKLDSSGNTIADGTSVNDLELVSVDEMRSYYQGSTTLSVAGNLPASASSDGDDPFKGIPTTIRAVDNEGRYAAVSLTFKKTADNADGSANWEVYEDGAVYDDGSAVPRTAATGLLGGITFGPDGTLTGGTDGEDVTFALALGSNFNNVALNIGQYGSLAGIRSVPDVPLTGMSSGQDGIAAGTYRDVEITSDGYVRATYGNGEYRDFYQVPNGVVINPTDLESVSGTAFRVTENSGELRLKTFGSEASPEGETPMTVGAALATGAIEQSNTDIADQFTTLIVAQRTYSANTKIISTADEMTQTAMGLKV